MIFAGRVRCLVSKRIKGLELENARLRKAVSDLTIDKQILQEASKGNY
jgi:hypothetical protein